MQHDIEEWHMSYLNANEVLPEELIKEIQQYIQGSQIYIPRTNGEKLGWGVKNGTRIMLKERNQSIRLLKKKGKSIDELADQFALSLETVRKIVYGKTA